jgi:hypothetical protein
MGIPPAAWPGGIDTLGSLRQQVIDWLSGDFQTRKGPSKANDAINDAIGSIWMSMMQWKLNRFMGSDSPVTFSLAANTERLTLISIEDPTAVIGVATKAGGALPARTVTFAYTLVTESGSETNISAGSVVNIPANQLAVLTSPGFPSANIENEEGGGPPPPGCVGYNVYASFPAGGANVTPFALQSQQPVPFGVNWQEPNAGAQPYPTAQQLAPTTNTTADNVSWITHMETPLPDGTLLAWNQNDIDGNVMRRLTQMFPTASQYQTYAWDLINGNQFEIRPKTGLAFTPRYWYVAKPRRLRYDQAQIPYVSIVGVHDFIVNYAVAKCKLSMDEYLAVQAWSTMAEQKRNEIIMSLNQENWNKDTRVVPYLY